MSSVTTNPVLESTSFVAKHATHAYVNASSLSAAVDKLLAQSYSHYTASNAPGVSPTLNPPDWTSGGYHFGDRTRPELLALYVLVVDTLNFCFWPDASWDYGRLAGAIKIRAEKGIDQFNSEIFSQMTEEELQSPSWLQSPIPLADERARLIREIGQVLLEKENTKDAADGAFSAMVRSAGKSALKLVQIITANFPGFRDQSIYKGHQIFLYKRAQILVGDLWAAFGGEGLGEFYDIDQLTMFADYRVPQILDDLGILHYSPALREQIESGEVIPSGSEPEIEIRAATVQGVEELKRALAGRGVKLCAIELDWILWNIGEEKEKDLPRHHKTLTIFY